MVAPLGCGSLKATVRPLKAPRLAAPTAPPSESVVSAAVMLEAAFGPTTVDGLAVAVSTSRGDTVGPPVALSQPAVPGPVLQPHQLSVASTVAPLEAPRFTAEPVAATLPVNRL